MSRLLMFKLVFTVITVTLLLFQITIWKKIAPRIRQSRYFRYFRAAYIAMVVLGQSMLWFAVFYPGRGIQTAFPEWYLPVHRVLLAINYGHFFWLLPLSLIWLIALAVKRLSKAVPALDVHNEHVEGISRADFFKKAGGAVALGVNLIPAATSVAAISGMFLGSREIWVNEKPITLTNLHDDLKGLRVVQISDIHIGNLINEKYLNFTLGLIQRAKPDYVLVTGDIIDNNNAFLPVAGTFFALLDAMVPGRVLGVMGNHDYIDDGQKAAAGFSAAGLNILSNDVKVITRRRGSLQIAGLDYPPLGKGRSEATKMYFTRMQKKLRADLPVVLMNHHPSDFEFFKTQKIDLVLSGHTHGGQINFSANRNSYLNGGHWVYKYYIDHYEEQGSQLYVNRGLGHWFPLRVAAPPEITVFTLS